MFKKIKKTIQKDLHKRYEQLEEKFLAFERRLYSHLEERLERLENQFDQINEILVQQTGKTNNSNTEAIEEEDLVEEKAEKTAPKSKKTSKKKADALAELPGLGASFEKKLKAEGIKTFEQLAALHASDIEALNNKIPGFKIRYERYEWRARASEKI